MSIYTARGRGLAAGSLALLLCGACTVPDAPERTLRAMDLEGVKIDVRSEIPVLFLRERGGQERELLIWIGEDEARSIALALEDVVSERPNAHDLIKIMLSKLDSQIRRVVVTELIGNTFYAEIELESGGHTVTIDSRPSDAIAIAVRTGTPLFASEVLLEATQGFPGPEDAKDVDAAPERETVEARRT